MRRTSIKPRGKRSREREKGMKAVYPYLCERAGGIWDNGRCAGACCELCGYPGMEHHTCHIQGRAQGGDESVGNLIVLCRTCHDKLDHGTTEERKGLRCVAWAIVKEKNEREGR